MKKYLLIAALLLLASPARAEEEEKSIFEIFRDLGSTECESLLREGDTLTNGSLQAADREEWDAAFYYSETAFHSYLKAHFGFCNEEPENKKLALERLEENKLLDKKLTCQYHTTEAHHASVRAQLALKHMTATISLKHAKDAVEYIDNALKFCAFDPKRVVDLTEIRASGVNAIALIEYEITLEE